MEIKDNILIKIDDKDIVNGTIIIPNNVFEIAPNVFEYNNKLEYIEIPDNVIKISCAAFACCNTLKYVKLPVNLSVIEESVFEKNSNLKKIILPSNLKEIKANGFYKCISLEEIILPNSTQIIDIGAFSGCINLKKIKMSNNITTIKDCAFCDCYNLREMTISNKIIEFKTNSFAGCENLNLNIETSLFNGNSFSLFRYLESLCINGIFIHTKNISSEQFYKELNSVRKKEIKEKIEFKLMKNNLFDKKYLNDKKHNEFIELFIKTLQEDGIYDIKVLNEYIEKYVNIHTNKNIIALSTIENKPFDNVISYLNNYDVSDMIVSHPNDIIFYGQELEEISAYITNVRYEIAAKYSNEMINIKMKKMLKNLTELSGNTNIFAMIFKKKTDIDITLNEDVIRQLRFYAEYKLEQENEEVSLLEKLKEIIKLYITKVDEQIKCLNNFSYDEDNLNPLINKQNKLELTTLVNNKISDLQKNLVIMIEYYKEINSIIGNNLSYMIKLNDIRTVLLPAVVLEVTKNKGVLKKQESIEKINNIILMLEEIMVENKDNKIKNENVDNLEDEVKKIINDEKVLIKK